MPFTEEGTTEAKTRSSSMYSSDRQPHKLCRVWMTYNPDMPFQLVVFMIDATEYISIVDKKIKFWFVFIHSFME